MDNCDKTCHNCANNHLCAFRNNISNDGDKCRFWKDMHKNTSLDSRLPYLMMAAKAEATKGPEAFNSVMSAAFDQTFHELDDYLSSFHVCDYPMVLAAMKAFLAIKLDTAPEDIKVMTQAFEDSACFVSVDMAALNAQRGEAS